MYFRTELLMCRTSGVCQDDDGDFTTGGVATDKKLDEGTEGGSGGCDLSLRSGCDLGMI